MPDDLRREEFGRTTRPVGVMVTARDKDGRETPLLFPISGCSRMCSTRVAHEHDVDFQALARRDRMFGRWAAHLMGMNGQAIENYARYLVMAEVSGATDEYVLQTVKQNLAECGVVGIKASEDRLRRKLERLHAIARAHFRADQ